MARTQTMVQLSDELLAVLDEEAQRRGISRSALIRSALEDHLRAETQALVSRRIVEGYERVPPGTPDEWGETAAVADQATADLLHRLDAEERAGGHDPW